MAECVGWGQASQIDGANVYTTTVLVPQSADDTAAYGCGYAWLLTDAELVQFRQLVAAPPGGAASSPFELPPTADMATAWGISFGLVVGCYAIARQVGAVLSILK